MMNPILEQLSDIIANGGDTYDWMEGATGVSRAILCRLAHRKNRFVSVETASKIAQAFGLELVLRRKK